MAKKKNAEKKPNIIQRIGKFFTDCKSEMKKISAVFIGALDFGLTGLLGTIMHIAN